MAEGGGAVGGERVGRGSWSVAWGWAGAEGVQGPGGADGGSCVFGVEWA